MLYQTIFCALLSIVIAQEAADKLKCTENEVVNECGGCDGTCAEPNPPCLAICGPPQCRCKEGFVRAANKTCIAQTTCAPAARSRRDATPACAENEEYHACGACDGTCKEPDVACTADCRPGQCGCKAGFVRDAGKCIKKEACKKTRAARQVNHAAASCAANEEWKDCSGCEGTCAEPEPFCAAACQPAKCQCKTGFVRDSGTCVAKTACKKTRAAREVNPCAFTTCPTNTRCDWHPIMCFRAPCPQPEAKCVPLDA